MAAKKEARIADVYPFSSFAVTYTLKISKMINGKFVILNMKNDLAAKYKTKLMNMDIIGGYFRP